MILLLALSCGDPSGVLRAPPDEPGPATPLPDDTPDPVDSGAPDTDPDPPVEAGPCPAHMALVEPAGAAAFCIDRYEAALDGQSPYEVPTEGVAVVAPGQVPQGYISGVVAADACAAAGKRLCSLTEWMRACQGPEGTTWPYGDIYDAGACNDTRAGHPVVEYFGHGPDIWDSEHMNDPGINQQPDTVDPGGANPGCVSADGVYDLHGNLHEWIDDPNGTFKGGFYADAVINGPGCHYATTAHSVHHHDYSTGFRCCAEPSDR